MSLSDDDDDDAGYQPTDDEQHSDLEPMQFVSYIPLQKAGEGTFSKVLRAQHLHTGRYVAIKCMKSVYQSVEKVNKLREIQALKKLSPHPNIVKLLEVLYDQENGKLALVMELMERNIYEWIRGRKSYIGEQRIKSWMWMLLKGIEHMHRNGVFHRDIKPENILLTGEVLKLADFGSCRAIHSKQPFTEYISTRWYRAPECLLTDGYYGFQMDMWGVGCVFFEIVTLMPLFPGKDEIDQIHKIHEVLGTPSPELLAKFQKHASSAMDFNFHKTRGCGLEKKIDRGVSKECIDLMKRMLLYNPEERISAKQALKHPYFKEIRESERRVRTKQRGPQVSVSQSISSPGVYHGYSGNGHTNSMSVDNSSLQITNSSGKYFPNVGGSKKGSNLDDSSNGTHSTNNSAHYISPIKNTGASNGDVSLPSLNGYSGAHTGNHTNSLKHHPHQQPQQHNKNKYPYFAKRTVNHH